MRINYQFLPEAEMKTNLSNKSLFFIGNSDLEFSVSFIYQAKHVQC